MHLIKNRPLCLLGLFVLASTVAVAFLQVWMCLAVLGLSLLVVFVFTYRKDRKMTLLCLAFAMIFALSLLLQFFFFELPKQNINRLSDTPHTLSGKVVETYSTGQATRYTIKLQTIDGEKVHYKAKATQFSSSAIEVGDVISFSGYIRSMSVSDENDIYDLADGAVAEVTPLGEMKVLKTTFSLSYHLAKFRQILALKMSEMYPKESGHLFNALLLGEKGELPGHITAEFRRAGISHLLAISGLHLMVLTAFLRRIFSKLRLGLHFSNLFCCLFVGFYCVMTGASISILRAAIMSILSFGSWFFWRKNDSITSLMTVGAVLLLFSRGAVYDYSFWLSFSATFGIIILSKLALHRKIATYLPHQKWAKSKFINAILLYIVNGFLVAVFASLFTLPLLCLFFGEFTLVSLPANMVCAPLAEFCLVLALPLFILAFIPALRGWAGALACSVSEMFLDVISWFNTSRHDTVSLRFDSVVLLATVFFVLLILTPFVSKKWGKRLFVTSLGLFFVMTAIVLAGNIAAKHNQFLHYRANKAQDAIVISCDKKICLVDVSYGTSSGVREVAELLSEHHISYVDEVVISHLHTSHEHYLSTLFQQKKVGTVYVPSPKNADEERVIYAIMKMADDYGVRFLQYNFSEPLFTEVATFETWCFDLHHPLRDSAFGVGIKVKDEQLCLLSPDFSLSTEFQAAAEYLYHCPTLIISKHGDTAYHTGFLPVSPHTKYVILSSPDIKYGMSEASWQHMNHILMTQVDDYLMPLE